MKKFIYLVLVFSILALSGNMLAKERKGADLIIQKTDETQIRGELIAVKENSLLLLKRETGADVSVDIGEIRIIEIVKESKVWKGIGYGLLGGAVIGVLVGYLLGDDPPIMGTGPILMTDDEKALGYGFYIGLFGATLGGIIGAHAGVDKTIQIEGKSDSEIKEILEELRKKARIRNSQ